MHPSPRLACQQALAERDLLWHVTDRDSVCMYYKFDNPLSAMFLRSVVAVIQVDALAVPKRDMMSSWPCTMHPGKESLQHS